MKHISSNIILSRTDSIGDMILTLPMAKFLKDKFPSIKVFVLGKEYTRAIVNTCKYVDGFIEMNEFLEKDILIDGKVPEAIIQVRPNASIAKRAKALHIKLRIGTISRLFHWNTCNELIRLSRKKSDLHEAQLNLKLLQPFGINKIFSYEEISEAYGLENIVPLKEEYAGLIDKTKYNLILHPKSKGSAREWGFKNFSTLIKSLDKKKYKIFISGTDAEKKLLQPLLSEVENDVTDISGLMNLEQFISFINQCDGLVACSTGPLHIAAATGIDAFGLYVPVRPLHAGRWGPIGKKAQFFVMNKQCSDCKNDQYNCHCILEIQPQIIFKAIEKAASQKLSI